ncbi:MAG: single-stranded-DNA-specific exonuclease RecJ [bacterium]
MKNITNNNEHDNIGIHNLNNDGYNNELIFSLINNNLEKFQLNNPARSIISKRIFSQLIFEPAFLKLILDKSGDAAVKPENVPENASVCLNSESDNLNILNITPKQNNIAADILDNYIYNYILNYINPSLKNLHNPFLMKDMDKAVSRITKALVNDEKICVFGDYDVDGITATSFLVLFLREINKYIVKVDNKDNNAGNNTQNIKTGIIINNNNNNNNINNNINNSIDNTAQSINNECGINYNSIADGETIIYKIPDRIKHGYGLGIEPINELISDNNNINPKNVSLIITVDLGITNYEPVVYANSKNIDVIICDHHEIPEKIPPAAAILNPKQKDDKFPFKFLPGVGIAFNLAMALRKKLFDDGLINSYPNLKDFLDIVCIGIVGDIVPMYDENRLLVSYGLKKINSDPRPGIKELKKICNLRFDNVTESDIAWKIAPKINSSGRVGNPNIAIELLISQDYEQARTLALKLDELNKKRKKLETECFNKAIIKINQMNNTLDNFNPMVILFDDSWHPGVIGIASSRLSEYLMKPVLLLSGYKEDIFIGSARSYCNIDIYSILKQFDNFFIKFGGHKLACGLSIKKSEFNQFIEAVNKFWENDLNNLKSNNANLDGTENYNIKFDYRVNYDEELLIGNINNELINKLKLMAPYGVLNEQPKFCIKNPLIDNIITRKVKNSYNSYNNNDSRNTNSDPANKALNNNLNLKKIVSNEYFTCDILNCSDKNKKSNKAIIFKNISCFRTEDFDFNNLNNKTVNSIIFEFFNNYIKILDIN